MRDARLRDCAAARRRDSVNFLFSTENCKIFTRRERMIKLLLLLILHFITIKATYGKNIDFTSCGSKDSVLFDVMDINASVNAAEEMDTYELDLLARISEHSVVNTSQYQIFVDIELEGFGLKESMLPELICDVAEPDPVLPRCIYNDTIRMKLSHTYDKALGSGVYKVQIRATALTLLDNVIMDATPTQCLHKDYRNGNGDDVLCVDFSKTIIRNWFSDFMKAAFAFSIASAASWILAQAFPFFRLPIITGYLIIGVAVGPTVGTNLITQFYVNMLSKHINAFALAFIAFAAGEEIFLPDLQDLLGSICRQLVAISFSTFVFVSLTFQLMLTQFPSVQFFLFYSTPFELSQTSHNLLSYFCNTGIWQRG